ncbi:MAG: type I-MYXAN CRISPR-associated protein Cas6/Cmx6 [Burkholderiaceae bacterium]|jgi:CRISPR-associated protein Cas6|nr:type I-MYXAN CRISPR-associated protein Cas6/Cmx6 [Burkholderiaceae bacterium]
MTDDELPPATMVDAVFPLAGRSLPRDHRLALADALEAAAPWLRDLPGAGLHPVNLVPGTGDPALLSHRARLVLRVPRTHVGSLHELAGRELDVASHRVQLGEPHLRELLPHNTLYAHFVASDADPDTDPDTDPDGDEAAFLDAVGAELDGLGAACRRICGRRQRIGGGTHPLVGFSLMLHGLAAAHALRVLEAGVGGHRRLGAGVFVPHRSAAAVGVA